MKRGGNGEKPLQKAFAKRPERIFVLPSLGGSPVTPQVDEVFAARDRGFGKGFLKSAKPRIRALRKCSLEISPSYPPSLRPDGRGITRARSTVTVACASA